METGETRCVSVTAVCRYVIVYTIVERFPKLDVAGSSPVSRSNKLFIIYVLGGITAHPAQARDARRRHCGQSLLVHHFEEVEEFFGCGDGRFVGCSSGMAGAVGIVFEAANLIPDLFDVGVRPASVGLLSVRGLGE